MTPTNELYKHTPKAETLIQMLSDSRQQQHHITEIPPTEHHHLTCESCGILLACFDLKCNKTTSICHDCATGERPAWSARDAVERYEKKRTEEKRQRLIEMVAERLEGLTNEALVQVCSFINEQI